MNQGHESTRTAQAIINLALITGNIGRPGTGANSITGQCNAMGSRVFGNITSLLGGHDATSPADRTKIAEILGVEESAIPVRPSLAYDEIIQKISEGKIKALWVIATNGAHSWINQNEFTALLGKLDFLVVQDMYTTTETAQLADLILPAAGWGEKDGTLINSERRIGVVKKVRRAPAWHSPTSPFASSWPNIGAARKCSAGGVRPKRPFKSSSRFRRTSPMSSPASPIIG